MYATENFIAVAEAEIKGFLNPARMISICFSESPWVRVGILDSMYFKTRLERILNEELNFSILYSRRIYYMSCIIRTMTKRSESVDFTCYVDRFCYRIQLCKAKILSSSRLLELYD